MLSFPQFVIFYNGFEPLENDKDYMELHLSDAFVCAGSNHLATDDCCIQPHQHPPLLRMYCAGLQY